MVEVPGFESGLRKFHKPMNLRHKHEIQKLPSIAYPAGGGRTLREAARMLTGI
jgi:hypothetical protein